MDISDKWYLLCLRKSSRLPTPLLRPTRTMQFRLLSALFLLLGTSVFAAPSNLESRIIINCYSSSACPSGFECCGPPTDLGGIFQLNYFQLARSLESKGHGWGAYMHAFGPIIWHHDHMHSLKSQLPTRFRPIMISVIPVL
ncbi:hypothetical protein Hypma_011230 [Hypsizygus marmoreus]|uniref:Uncharacterized protein n=1 Tax=Hypsizygus marmoreus TaxID=39966 RepID=A0A369JPV0_HYPMA|nr:hypothetical protein Hypma_011230 [Hypsizygus marmoreus]